MAAGATGLTVTLEHIVRPFFDRWVQRYTISVQLEDHISFSHLLGDGRAVWSVGISDGRRIRIFIRILFTMILFLILSFFFFFLKTTPRARGGVTMAPLQLRLEPTEMVLAMDKGAARVRVVSTEQSSLQV